MAMFSPGSAVRSQSAAATIVLPLILKKKKKREVSLSLFAFRRQRKSLRKNKVTYVRRPTRRGGDHKSLSMKRIEETALDSVRRAESFNRR